MQSGHDLRQFAHFETDLGARRKVLEPKIDRIRTRLHSRAQFRPVSGGTHDFRLPNGAHWVITQWRGPALLQYNSPTPCSMNPSGNWSPVPWREYNRHTLPRNWRPFALTLLGA